METLYCQVCDIKFMNEDNLAAHVNGKRHKSNLNVQNMEEAGKRKVYVGSIGALREPKEATLKYHFSFFGPVKNINVLHHSGGAIVEFRDLSSAESAIAHRGHNCRGVNLTVRKFIVKTRQEQQQKAAANMQNREGKSQKTQDHIFELLKSAKSTEDQMLRLSNDLCLTQQDKKTRQRICDNLTFIFSPFFKSCQIHQFGSSINGFGMQGCDLDLFIELNEEVMSSPSDSYLMSSTSFIKPQIPLPYSRDLKSIKYSHGPLGSMECDTIKPYDLVKLLSRILSSNRSEFSEVVTVPSNRCPIIRFAHRPTGIQCDLSLNNKVAVYNSRLLHLYSTDPSVHSVVTVVRQWAKAQALTASPQFTHLFTSYSLTWLVLFYFQNCDPPVLPKVVDLQGNFEGVEHITEAGSDCVYVPMTTSLPSHNSRYLSVVDLLKGFFQFYTSRVDIDQRALLTRDARHVPIEDLGAMEEYKGYKPGFMAVLDPFILSHNVTKNINEKTKERLLAQLHVGLGLVGAWPSGPPEDRLQPWGVMELLTPQPDPQHLVATLTKKQRRIQLTLDQEGPPLMTFTLTAEQSQLIHPALCAKAQQENLDSGTLWSRLVQDMVLKVLVQIFLVQYNVLSMDKFSPTNSLSMTSEKDKESPGASPQQPHLPNNLMEWKSKIELISLSDHNRESCSHGQEHKNSSNLITGRNPTVSKKRSWTEIRTDTDGEKEDWEELKKRREVTGGKQDPVLPSCATENNIDINIQHGIRNTSNSDSDNKDMKSHSIEMSLKSRESEDKNDVRDANTSALENNLSKEKHLETQEGCCSEKGQVMSEISSPASSLSVKCQVYVVVWRDRTKIKKQLRKDQPLSSLALEQAVSLQYLAEHTKAGTCTSDLAAQIIEELARYEKIPVEQYGQSGIDQSLIDSLKTARSRFECQVKHSPREASGGEGPTVVVEVQPSLSTAEELAYFQLFFESFKQVTLNMVRSNLIG